MAEGLGFGKQKLIAEIIKQNWGVESPWDKKNFNYQDVLYIIQEMLQESGKAYFDESQAPRKGFFVFKDFVRHCLYRNVANYDSMILLTAEKGTGKSSAAIMIAREWCKILGIKFDPDRHIAYNNADVMRKIDALDKFEPIICDEAIRFAAAADWNRKENKELRKKLAQVRTKHLLYILCFPLKVYKLEKTYLESYVNYWVDLFGRGIGAIYVKDRNPVQDSWRMKEFQKIGSYTEFTNVSKVQAILKKHPNFWRIVRFPKPPRWLYDRYLTVREKNIYDDDNVMADVSTEDVHRALMVLTLRDIMMHDTTLSMNRIILHIKNEYDIPITKGNVQELLTDAKHLVGKIREEAMKL